MQKQLFRVISVLQIKGPLITCKIIYLLFDTICIVFGKDSSHAGYFKSVISKTLRMTARYNIIVKIHYTVILREIDLIQLFKKTKKKLCTKEWKFTRILFFFFFMANL
jgi:hypothetical protein